MNLSTLLLIAPLDGSKILSGLLPAGFAKFMAVLERYGPFVIPAKAVVRQAHQKTLVFWIPAYHSVSQFRKATNFSPSCRT
jgi:hypothetical protein